VRQIGTDVSGARRAGTFDCRVHRVVDDAAVQVGEVVATIRNGTGTGSGIPRPRLYTREFASAGIDTAVA